MLAADIRQLEQWQRSQLPSFHDAATQAVISWLIREQGRAKPLGELYLTPGYADGALRGVVTLLAFHGLIDISRDIQDARRFVAKPTRKLIRRMRMYAEQLQHVIDRHTLPVSSPSRTRPTNNAGSHQQDAECPAPLTSPSGRA